MQGLLRWFSPTCVNLQLDNGFPRMVFEVPLGSLTPCLIVSGFLILLLPSQKESCIILFGIFSRPQRLIACSN